MLYYYCSLVLSDFEADYTFAFTPAVLLLPDAARLQHNFTTVNVSLSVHECYRKGHPVAAALLRAVVGYDTAVINQLMFTFRSRGLLVDQHGGEWWWSKGSMPPKGGYK
jgi:hypothetical protein